MTDADEKAAIVAALKRASGKVGKAARYLGTPRRTLQRRMRRYGIPEGKRGRPLKRAPRYGRRALKYAVPAIGAAIVGGLLLTRRGTST